MSEANEAKLRFEAFHGRPPEEGEIGFVEFTDVVLPVGKLHSISYTLELDDGPQTYYHEFNEDNRPELYSSSDGKQLHILAGEYEFASKGIVG